mgnify:CR=1 FL=1
MTGVQTCALPISTPTALAWDGTNLYVTDPSNRRVLVFTAAEPRVPINGVRNAASREVYALGAIVVGGTIAADDVITVKINSKSYTYKIVKDDTYTTILKGIANSINSGSGDPNVTAYYVAQLANVKLQAKKGGPDGNSITISTSLSDKAQITATTSGATLTGGQDAAIVAPGTVVTFLGTKLSNVTAAADPNANILPRELGNVQVYFDGIRAPLLLVSPTEIRAQIPFEVADSNSISAYIRVVNPDGSVTVTTAVGVPISQQNPGIFSQDGVEPRVDRKSTRLNSSHIPLSRMPSSA